MEQVAAKFADVLEQRAVPADDIVPELAGGEFLANDECAAGDENRARHLHPADAVIHGQAVIHPVRWLRTHHAGKPMAPLHDAGMADVGGFGQPGRAGGIDVECAIFDGGGRRSLLLSASPEYCSNLEIDTPERRVFAAMNPDRGSRRKLRQRRGQLSRQTQQRR